MWSEQVMLAAMTRRQQACALMKSGGRFDHLMLEWMAQQQTCSDTRHDGRFDHQMLEWMAQQQTCSDTRQGALLGHGLLTDAAVPPARTHKFYAATIAGQSDSGGSCEAATTG